MTKQNDKTGDQLFEEDVKKSMALASIQGAITAEHLQLSEKIGAIKAFNFAKKLMTVGEIKLLAEVKNNKLYKGAKILDTNGQAVIVNNWANFCSLSGLSHQHIDENIRNLSAFGEDFLEASQRMGVGYRDLRRLRTLPDEEREVIIHGEAVQAEDKESLLDILEEMSAKHVKEKDARDKEITELKAELKASEKVISDRTEKINELDRQLTKREQATTDDKVKELFSDTMKAHIGVLSELMCFEEAIKDCLESKDANLERFVTYYLMDIRSTVSDLFQDYGLDYTLVDKDFVRDVEGMKELALNGGGTGLPEYVKSGVGEIK